ncbi:AraC family transcriptional regulator [Pseudomonas sp. UFMG81]|uniref:AraC family transcriptional regulator n=1 Tax=Pseudomonas sp. UFMG81 TaxID=2745936 RepID=UPI00188FD303|nr:AraC family transcriptional regulator [Pseudomonas sp. UFMG81]
MTTVPLVRALSLVGFHDFATRQGLDPARMLKQIGLPLQSLQDEDSLFPYQQYCALLEACSQQSGNPLFGLHYGLFQASSVFGDLLHVLRNARTVGDALLELRNHYALYNAAAEVGLDSENGQVILSYQVHQTDAPGVRQAEELACAAGIQLMRALLGPHWHPTAIWLRHSASADTALYAQALGMPVTFDAPGLALVFESSVLAQPCATCDEALQQLVVRSMQRLEPLSSDELASQIKQLLQHLLPSGRATAQKVASIMALTPNQLRQAMAREGLSFQQLLEDVRQGMAHAYLAKPSVDIGELARLLGYSDTSGFCRAFQRWHNMSPLNWQKAQGIQRQPRLLGRGRRRL